MQSNGMGHVWDTEGCPRGDKCRVTEWVLPWLPRMQL